MHTRGVQDNPKIGRYRVLGQGRYVGQKWPKTWDVINGRSLRNYTHSVKNRHEQKSAAFLIRIMLHEKICGHLLFLISNVKKYHQHPKQCEQNSDRKGTDFISYCE